MKSSTISLLSILAPLLTPHFAAQPLKARQSAVCDEIGTLNAVDIQISQAIPDGEDLPGLELLKTAIADLEDELDC